MTNTVGSTLSSLLNKAATATSASSSSASVTTADAMGKDDFLKLFLTSLQYQDPMSAMDTNEMMSQMSQLTLIEQVQNMSQAVEAFTAAAQSTALDSGMKFLGKQVEGTDTSGNVVTGVVDQVRVSSGVVELLVGESVIPMKQVTSVSEPK